MAAYLLSFREGLEAVLLVSIVLGTLRQLRRSDLAGYVWLAVGSALALSIGVAGVLSLAGIEMQGRSEALFEGSTLLCAALLLTGMLFWMRRQGPRLHARISAGVARATERAGEGSGDGMRRVGMGLFALTALAVLREGIELALFLAAASFSASPATTALGALLGLGCAAGLGVLLFRKVVRLDLRRFFQVTNVILIVFAAGMVNLGVHELVEAGMVPGLLAPVWDLSRVLSDRSTVGELLRSLLGYSSDPALTEVLAYVGYLAVVGWALWLRRPAEATRATQ